VKSGSSISAPALSKARLIGLKALGRLSDDEMQKVEIAVKLSLALP
jgi:hypothetical protein